MCQWCHVAGPRHHYLGACCHFYSNMSHGASRNSYCPQCAMRTLQRPGGAVRPLQRGPGGTRMPALRSPQGAVLTRGPVGQCSPLRMWGSGVRQCVRVRRWSQMRWTVRQRCGGELASEMHGLRQVMERLSSSSASSLCGAASHSVEVMVY